MQGGRLPVASGLSSASLPSHGAVVPHSTNPEDWPVVLRSYQGVIVRYNRGQRALTVETRNALGLVSPPVAAAPSRDSTVCPFCRRPLHDGAPSASSSSRNSNAGGTAGLGQAFYNNTAPRLADRGTPGHLSTDYFHLLSEAHQDSPSFGTPEPSRPGTPVFAEISASLDESAFSEGYYQKFFNEIGLLGRGMSGSVYLCQHVLNGNPIGLFACKKIPVGNNARSLIKALKEVTQLVSLRHPNIVAVHHVWLETAAPALGPPVPCLFALMDYAHDGSLDKYIRSRGGLRQPGVDSGTNAEALKQKARMRRQSKASGSNPDARPIHLLNQLEIEGLFFDITAGLAFLHERNMLHLDIKAENILLHRADGDESYVPTAMLSDFGSAEARNAMNRSQRSGTTGTLDYLAPESFLISQDGRPRQHAAALDIWALGLVLHLLMFFRLPYDNIEDVDELTEEIKAYGGFDRHTARHTRRDLPDTFLDLLESLININPFERPSAADVLERLHDMRGQQEKRHRPRRPAPSPKFSEVSSEALIPRSPPPRSTLILPAVVQTTKTLPAASQKWAVTVFKSSRARTNELQTIGMLAIRAFLLSYLGRVRRSTTEVGSGPSNLPVATLALLISVSAIEVVNNKSLSVSFLTTIVLAILAYFVPRSVFLF